jgi:hypothetical protein
MEDERVIPYKMAIYPKQSPGFNDLIINPFLITSTCPSARIKK